MNRKNCGFSIPAQPQHSTTNSLSRRSRTKADQPLPSLGRAYRGGDAFPFRRQAGKIVGQSGEIAIDCSGAAARLVSRRIFQRRG